MLVDTIGSVDNLIENYASQIKSLIAQSTTQINELNENSVLVPLTSLCNFERGKEIGSKNYSDNKLPNYIEYIRVGDLLNSSNTYINQNFKDIVKVKEDDILIALDGAPGRLSVGLKGSISSGIYKIILADSSLKGIIFFELMSDLNRDIINKNSQGTTILHASKSIPELMSIPSKCFIKNKLNYEFNRLVSLKIKIKKLKLIKEELLSKYFTNQQ